MMSRILFNHLCSHVGCVSVCLFVVVVAVGCCFCCVVVLFVSGFVVFGFVYGYFILFKSILKKNDVP